jgi:hypothetical protein
MTPPGDPLDDLMASWQVPAAVPVRFAAGVHARLAKAAVPSPWEHFATLLFRPLPLSAATAAALAAGVLAALPSRSLADHQNDPGADYLRSISPFASTSLHGNRHP